MNLETIVFKYCINSPEEVFYEKGIPKNLEKSVGNQLQ